MSRLPARRLASVSASASGDMEEGAVYVAAFRSGKGVVTDAGPAPSLRQDATERGVSASRRRTARAFLWLCAIMLLAAPPALGWEHWGGDRGGTRFSPLAQITSVDVGNLVRAWEFRSGDLEARAPAVMARTK